MHKTRAILRSNYTFYFPCTLYCVRSLMICLRFVYITVTLKRSCLYNKRLYVSPRRHKSFQTTLVRCSLMRINRFNNRYLPYIVTINVRWTLRRVWRQRNALHFELEIERDIYVLSRKQTCGERHSNKTIVSPLAVKRLIIRQQDYRFVLHYILLFYKTWKRIMLRPYY